MAGVSGSYDGVRCEVLADRLGVAALTCLDEVGSTLDVIHEAAAGGAPSGTAVIADMQTKGRGRQGRGWYSPRGAGIWLGYLVRPRAAPVSGLLALRVGMAVAEALREAGADVRVKWPNDLMLDDRKVAGILCEARDLHGRAWVAVGVGMNVRGPLPPELGGVAAVLDEALDGISRVEVLELVVPRLADLGDAGEFTPDERERFAGLDWLRGREVAAPRPGRAAGVAPDGALLVDTGTQTARVTGGTVRLARER